METMVTISLKRYEELKASEKFVKDKTAFDLYLPSFCGGYDIRVVAFDTIPTDAVILQLQEEQSKRRKFEIDIQIANFHGRSGWRRLRKMYQK